MLPGPCIGLGLHQMKSTPGKTMTAWFTDMIEMKEDQRQLNLITALITINIGQVTLIMTFMIIESQNTLVVGNVVFITIMPKPVSTNLSCNVDLATSSAIKQDIALKTEVSAMRNVPK